ncbi:site-specific integrase [Acetobacter thailandicus]|uniref:hypothetical protein n=1 Tax=Acetobacter thailandicus TaxID=1502842 RepID=UPI0020129496|nr:hypothetical protein [Acetobacter thailandicus]
MQFAINNGWRDDDPTTSIKVKRQKSEGIHAWTDQEIDKYLLKWGSGTIQRLAMSLMLYTGQRRSDVVRMGPGDVQNGMIYVRQEKTDACLWIPLHSELQDVTQIMGGGQSNVFIQIAGWQLIYFEWFL